MNPHLVIRPYVVQQCMSWLRCLANAVSTGQIPHIMEGFVPNMTGTVRKAVGEREKLSLLHTQMEEMSDDFQDMQRAREESRKQMEAKFQDVYRKIQSTKDLVTAEGKRVNDMLMAFQSKFEFQLKELRDYADQQMESERTARVESESRASARMDDLGRLIEEEKQERLKQTDDMLRAIREKLEFLERAYETEKTTRVQREKEILAKLDEEVFSLSERMTQERIERSLKVTQLHDQVYQDIKAQNKTLEKFQQNTYTGLSDMRQGVLDELHSRLDHQDEIIDNLSNFLRTFQDTMKLLGKDV